MDNNNLLCETFLDTTEFGAEDLFSILENLEDFSNNNGSSITTTTTTNQSASQDETSPKRKRQKVIEASEENNNNNNNKNDDDDDDDGEEERVLSSHITVERNRRKQMNEHLSVLRSLMPSFYVKRGDQASIIGGVVDYINELQQLLQCLEAKKHRKVVYNDNNNNNVLSPRLIIPSPILPSSLSPRKPPISPIRPPISPRIFNMPISPRTPQPGSPWLQAGGGGYLSPTTISNNSSSIEPSPSPSSGGSSIINDNVNDLVVNSKSAMADVEVKFSGKHVLLKTVSSRIPGQAMRIVSALEDLALEILHVSISTAHETMLNSFTIKVDVKSSVDCLVRGHRIPSCKQVSGTKRALPVGFDTS
ncbi:hypothetical protein PIB30_086809 [Stylosanthes scabra]|uniref:BHLH domain-containing protein n=1 Tax=Stylosanthes scabra TaxID=79078 RepID=A0ABU6WRK0_9FABA|nr:hypothetical protein [Stylosanthes scabra]